MNCSPHIPQRQPAALLAKIYNSIAKEYDAGCFECPTVPDKLSIFLACLPPDASVLEVACGTGRDAWTLCSSAQVYEYVGIDIAARMLDIAKARAVRGYFRLMDMQDLKYPERTFHGVWAAAAFPHLDSDGRTKAFQQIARVLLSGGALALTARRVDALFTDSYGRTHHPLCVEDLCAELSTAGFSAQVVNQQAEFDNSVNRSEDWIFICAVKNPDTAYSDCFFCPQNRFPTNRELKEPVAASILWATQNFHVAVDVAPLVPGHLLIVSNRHLISMGQITTEEVRELSQLKSFLRETITSCFAGGVVFMEHGSNCAVRAGSCIDHAHLHALPLHQELETILGARLGGGQPCTQNDLNQMYRKEIPYVAYEGHRQQLYSYTSAHIPSQFLRVVVCEALGTGIYQWFLVSNKSQVRDSFTNTLQLYSKALDRHLDAKLSLADAGS